jgi:hypothetical protein
MPTTHCDSAARESNVRPRRRYAGVMLLEWIVAFGLIGSAFAVGALVIRDFWTSAEEGDKAWSVAAGLVAFEMTFAAAFASSGMRGALYGIWCGLSGGASPALALSLLLDHRRQAQSPAQHRKFIERYAITYRVGFVFATQVFIIAAAHGKPWGMLIGIALLGLLWVITNDRFTGWLARRMRRFEHGSFWACVVAVPFAFTGQLMTMPSPHPNWSHWAPGLLTSLSSGSVWIILAVVVLVMLEFRRTGEDFLRRCTGAICAPLVATVFTVGLIPEIKSSRALAVPTAMLFASAFVYAVVGLYAAAASRTRSQGFQTL